MQSAISSGDQFGYLAGRAQMVNQQHQPRSAYDERAVAFLVAIEQHLKSFAPSLDQRMRRTKVLCSALEIQVEHASPPPSPEVLDHLQRALLAQAHLINANVAWIAQQLTDLRRHLDARPNQ